MENTAGMYQPHALVLEMKGNPEQLVRDWEMYISGSLSADNEEQYSVDNGRQTGVSNIIINPGKWANIILQQ